MAARRGGSGARQVALLEHLHHLGARDDRRHEAEAALVGGADVAGADLDRAALRLVAAGGDHAEPQGAGGERGLALHNVVEEEIHVEPVARVVLEHEVFGPDRVREVLDPLEGVLAVEALDDGAGLEAAPPVGNDGDDLPAASGAEEVGLRISAAVAVDALQDLEQDARDFDRQRVVPRLVAVDHVGPPELERFYAALQVDGDGQVGAVQLQNVTGMVRHAHS